MPGAESAAEEAASGAPRSADPVTTWHFRCGTARRWWQGVSTAGLLLLLMGASQVAVREGTLTSVAFALVLFSGLALWVWLQRELRPPAGDWVIQARSGALLLVCSPDAVAQKLDARMPIVLPGAVILTSTGRRYWMLADECSQAAWRRLCLCARFAGQEGVARLR